jgi:hypothetical protein
VRVIDLDDPLTSARDVKSTVTSLLHALGAIGPPAERVVRVIDQAIAKYVPTSTLSTSAQRTKFAEFFPEEDGGEPAAVKWAELSPAERALDSSFAHVLAMYFTGSRLTLHDDYAVMIRRSAVFVSHLWEHFITPDIVASKLSIVSAMAELSDPADSARSTLTRVATVLASVRESSMSLQDMVAVLTLREVCRHLQASGSHDAVVKAQALLSDAFSSSSASLDAAGLDKLLASLDQVVQQTDARARVPGAGDTVAATLTQSAQQRRPQEQQQPRQQQQSPRRSETEGRHEPNPPGKIVCRRCECVASQAPYGAAHFQHCDKRYHKSGRELEPWEADRQGHEQSTGAFKFNQAPPKPQGWTQPRPHAERAAAATRIAAIEPAAEPHAASAPAPVQHASVDVDTLVMRVCEELMKHDVYPCVPVAAAAQRSSVPSGSMSRGALLDSGSGAHVFASVAELNTARLQVLKWFTGASSVTQGMGTRSIRTPSVPVTLSDVALFRAIPSDIVSLGRLIAAGWHFHAVGAADGQINLTTPHGAVVPVVLRRHVLWIPASHIDPVATTVGSASPLADPVRLRQLVCRAVLRNRLRNRIRSAVARLRHRLAPPSTTTDETTPSVPPTLPPADLATPSAAVDQPAPVVPTDTPIDDKVLPAPLPTAVLPVLSTSSASAPNTLPPAASSSVDAPNTSTTTDSSSTPAPSASTATDSSSTSLPTDAPSAPTVSQQIRTRLRALLLSALGWLFASPAPTPSPRSPTARQPRTAPAESPAPSYRLGRSTVPADSAASVFHAICNHRGPPVMRAAGNAGTVWPGLPSRFWGLSSSCAACAEANQGAVRVRHNNRSPSHSPSVGPPPEPVFQPGHDPARLRGAEVLSCDIVYVPMGDGRPKQKALFVVDVHSTASFLVKIADKPAAEGALRTVLNRVNVTSRAYQIRVGCDNDSALVAALTRAAKPFPNVHVTTYPSGEPNCNPSERMWRHIQAAGRANAVAAGHGPRWLFAATEQAVTHNLWLPAPSRANARPIDMLHDGLPAGITLCKLEQPCLVPFGCVAYATRKDTSAADTRPAALPSARAEPGYVVGYADPWGTVMRVWIPNRKTQFETVCRRAPVCQPHVFQLPQSPTKAPAAPAIFQSFDLGVGPSTSALSSSGHPFQPTDASTSPLSTDAPTPVSSPSTEAPSPVVTPRRSPSPDPLLESWPSTPVATATAASSSTDASSTESPLLSLPALPAIRIAGRLRRPRPLRPLLDVRSRFRHALRGAFVAALARHGLPPPAESTDAPSGLGAPVDDVAPPSAVSGDAADLAASSGDADDPAYTATLDAARSATSPSDLATSTFALNNYVPGVLADGAEVVARVSADIPWKRALASPDRDAAIAALDKELSSLERRSLTPIPPDHPERLAAEQRATPGRVVLAQKRDGRYKGRGCVRGDKQDKVLLDGTGFVYYAPSSQAAAVRALLFRGRRPPGYTVATVDVTTAFLQSMPFDETVPPRYVWFRHPVSGERIYYRQRTPLYGEASAPRRWADTLAMHLRSCGFVPGENDKAVWFNKQLSVSVICHVDDLLFSGPAAAVHSILAQLGSLLDLDEPHFLSPTTPIDFLGALISINDTHIFMSLESYIHTTLEMFEPIFSHSIPCVSTPFQHDLDGGEELTVRQRKDYATGVGALGWISNCRPDVLFAFSRLSQHLSHPTTDAWLGLRRALGYLKARPSLCLGQRLDADPTWAHYTDSDYAANTEAANHMRPHLGVLITCGGTPIHFSSKVSKVAFAHPQITTAHADVSVAACEIYALSNGVCDALGLSYVVEELGLPSIPLPLQFFVDNTTAKCFANGTVQRSKLKHIDCRQCWVTTVRDSRLVRVDHIGTEHNLADFFTKSLPTARFECLRDQLMMCPHHRS